YLRPEAPPDPDGWVEFRCDLQADICCEPVKFMLFDFKADSSPGEYEKNEHQRELPRRQGCDFPDAVWFTQDAARVVTRDPRLSSQSNLRVHLISQSRFRPGQMYLWDPVTDRSRRISQSGENHLGPIFDVQLEPHERSFAQFKFIRKFDEVHPEFEVDIANRWWVADDGPEIWTHSDTGVIAPALPKQHRLRIHYRQTLDSLATMRLWAEGDDYATDIAGVPGDDGWTTYETNLFAHLPYGCLFWNPGLHLADEWEHAEAKRRQIAISEPTEFWTLEGDSHLYTARPEPNVQLDLTVANRDLSPLRDSLFVHVWINHARAPLAERIPVDAQGHVSLQIYPEVVTSIKFLDEYGRWENLHRHTIQLSIADSPANRYVVLGRRQPLEAAPSSDMVADPPFSIRRPGAYVDGDTMRFALHAPQAARVDLIGEWTDWLSHPISMKSTRDGTYWWASVPIQQIEAGLPSGMPDYHGAKYQFLFDEHRRLQDPAAGWVERANENAASRLVRPDRYVWHDREWHRPGWESLIVYQLHPSRFTNRFQNEPPLRRVAREISHHSGYIRELGVTAIQLMPINEVGSDNSWGYDPAYFYAVENNYCGEEGPDDLKYLVDTCHQHGLAVIVDVVFNHAGGTHNILWQVARESFFDGDTEWGAMINFDHPQCRHFFAQNLVYLANEFHIDGFRLDHTATIVHSAAWDRWSLHVRKLGSGGGWEFLHTLRHAVTTQVGHNCLLTAEHLPNEWSLTNYGGPMDSQWCDDFHDRMVDACKRKFGMSRLADAFQLSHSVCDDWYKITNYAESHDEVGNVRDRVAYLAEYGQGWRMSKVAAAATLMSRGIPLFFMGGESGEDRQFHVGGSDPLDLAEYLSNPDRGHIRAWWRDLCHLRRNPSIQGPAPLRVVLAESQLLAFTRGVANDFYILLNFGGWSGERSLESLNLPWGRYRELYNSTWPAFAIQAEHEDEHSNGGRDARLQRNHQLNVPDYGVVILERV
ncbi:MAG TPA: alpha-amylase family glycosyl hydrolase, partial [Planctomycetaceae bacterium]|nr:alpha-amylase family glycosyl hydrolase [Planctomycetaceae bacterium]